MLLPDYYAVLFSNNSLVVMMAVNIALFLCLATCRIWQKHCLPFSSMQGFVTRFQQDNNLKFKALKFYATESSGPPLFVNLLFCLL